MNSKKFMSAFAVLLIILFSFGKSFGQCEGNNGVAIVQAYSFVFSYPQDLPQHVLNNQSFYRSNGPAIRCGRQFANRLWQAALTCPSYNQIYSKAVEVAGAVNLPQMAPGVASDMYRHCTDLSLLARYIDELNTVLPALADGNPQPYYNSSIYQLSSVLLNGMSATWAS
jgi:hypothetical protein